MAESIVLTTALIVQVLAIWQKRKLGIDLTYEVREVRMYCGWLFVQGLCFGIATQYWLIRLVNVIIGG